MTTGGTKDHTAPLFFLTTGLSPHLEIYKNSVSLVQPILSIALLIWAGSLVSLLYMDYGVLGSLFSLPAVGFMMAGPRSSAGCMVSAWKLPADDRQLRAKASWHSTDPEARVHKGPPP